MEDDETFFGTLTLGAGFGDVAEIVNSLATVEIVDIDTDPDSKLLEFSAFFIKITGKRFDL